jgi:DNA repair protein RadC
METLYVRESSAFLVATDDQVLSYAAQLMERKMRRGLPVLERPDTVRRFLRLNLARLDYEVFGCFYLDTRYRLLAKEELFRGTVDNSAVHPREVVKAALNHGASSLLVYHNHPSGIAEPSMSDELITNRLRDALALIDVKLVDHLIVGESIFSFAESGLL